MNSKLRREIVKTYLNIDTIAMFILSFVIMWQSLVAGIICLALVCALYLYHRYYTEKRLYKKLTEYKEAVLKDRNDLAEAFAQGAPLLLCIIDKNLKVHWSNEDFDNAVNGSKDISEIVGKEKLKNLFDPTTDSVRIDIDERCFEVSSEYLTEKDVKYRVLFWKDITQQIRAISKYNDSLACLAYVNIDNLEAIQADVPIENRSKITAAMEEVIFGWAKEVEGSVFRLDYGRYGVMFLQKHLADQKAKNFAVLDKMHEVEIGTDFPASISVGIGLGEEGLSELQEAASEAIELALGRGGDQVVIRLKDGETEYYGGNLPAVAKRNKGRSRMMAHALANHINDSDQVYIMGHTRPDMDSFGSAIGMYSLTVNSGKPAYIILENPGDGIEIAYHSAFTAKDDNGECIYKIISHEEALENITPKTLLIMVDHHREAISECKEIIPKAERIAIIDHHRRSEDCVEGKFNFMESYASSASEMVTEILQYSGERGEVSKFEAEVLLAGISLDTNNFRANTGVRTFDAAAWLKRQGADSGVIKNYFKIDLSFYQKKINVIANAEILPNGVAVAYTKDIDPAMQLIVSQAADELLTMKGVDAAIAAGRNGVATMVSARSNGKYNVQLLMEKLGGGGHQLAAAVQLDVGPEEAISQVVAAMRLEGIL